MKIRIVLWVVSVAVAAFMLLSGESILLQRTLADKTLRLHVVANSDSVADQEQKLRVRDRILQEVGELTLDCHTLDDTIVVLEPCLPQLEKSAQELLEGEGSTYSVRITLCKENFSTRDYDTFSLPAGKYHSLRVVIGEGAGKNWWCVVFPSLCNAASGSEMEKEAVEAGLSEEELAMIRKVEPKYVIRFKMLELIEGLFR